jgi:hypothetical protein
VVVFPEPFTPTINMIAGLSENFVMGALSSRFINSDFKTDCN